MRFDLILMFFVYFGDKKMRIYLCGNNGVHTNKSNQRGQWPRTSGPVSDFPIPFPYSGAPLEQGVPPVSLKGRGSTGVIFVVFFEFR